MATSFRRNERFTAQLMWGYGGALHITRAAVVSAVSAVKDGYRGTTLGYMTNIFLRGATALHPSYVGRSSCVKTH